MNTTPVASSDNLTNDYAARWVAERPASDRVHSASDAKLHSAQEANEAFTFHLEILPDYSHCGINE